MLMLAAEPISEFTERHPTIKVLALSFLLGIWVAGRRARRTAITSEWSP